MQLTRTLRTRTPLATMSQQEITAIEASVARTLQSSVTPLDTLDITRSLVRPTTGPIMGSWYAANTREPMRIPSNVATQSSSK